MEKTYFISGHENYSLEDFAKTYIPLLQVAVAENANFVIGDCDGVDAFAQIYLSKHIDPDNHSKVKVFFKGDMPKNFISSKFMAIGEFVSHEEAAVAMTFCSDEDIACLRKEKWDSLTAKNILRRYTPEFDFSKYLNANKKHPRFWNIIFGIGNDPVEPNLETTNEVEEMTDYCDVEQS